ncbi:redoxin domain-containing protein [Haloarcula halophila]|uniref:redoxin domain-containing protein n=1 Tax=Haloarcula TaxID=2237 RepID=UPI0023E3B256|nr:redoxin domain-containing protein [Halomicroarcula sp. DFY41]
MISEGTVAPSFELPALADGQRRRVALDDYVGEDVVILAFYPADFNPACDGESCDLDELDLFTMQKDVTILGVSPDSVYSHRAFAEQYNLNVPLLSDTDHDVAEEYGIDFVDDIGQQLIERGVVVIDHDGVVQYAWSTADLTELPAVEPIKDAIAETGGDDTAFARYRVGHAHYTEGRRAFTSAMGAFQDSEWMMAQGDFQQARKEFAEAEDRFDTALRFVDDDGTGAIYEGAKTKANALWQAADWLAESASDYSSGSGAAGQEWRDDAERPLETARKYEEPPDPDDWPPEMDDLEKDESQQESILPRADEPDDAALDVDIDAEVEESESAEPSGAETTPSTATSSPEPDETEAESGTAVAADSDQAADSIDDAELEEIQAELEATHPESEPTPEEITEEPTAMVEAPPDSVADSVDADTPAEDEDLADLQAELAGQPDSTDESVPEEPTAMVEAPPGDPADGGTAGTEDADSPEDPTDTRTDSGEDDTEVADDDGSARTTDSGPDADSVAADEGVSETGEDVSRAAPDDRDRPDDAATPSDGEPGGYAAPDDEFGGYVTPDTGPVTGSEDEDEDDEGEAED